MTDYKDPNYARNNDAGQTNTAATSKDDISEGAALGVIGGAIVGGLAGGPLGAVVGGIAGGAASATAVAGVDKYEDKHGRTSAEYFGDDAGVISPEGFVSEVDYQRHFASRYAGTDESYGRHQPAYLYGADLADVPEYHNHDWDTVQAWAIGDWNRNDHEEWDKVKDSIRYGWEHRRSKDKDQA